jgi:hypothetical protein
MFPFFSGSLSGSKARSGSPDPGANEYHMSVPLIRSKEHTSCFRAGCKEGLVKLFKKPKSRFYWFDFTVRGQRYRGSTGETTAARATKVASMKLARALEHGNLFPNKAPVLADFAERFLTSLERPDWKRRPRSSTETAGAC